MTKKRIFRLNIFLIPLIIICSQCLNFKKHEDPRGSEYAGAATCQSCHKDIYHSYLHTAHYAASQPANDSTVQGSFIAGSNEISLGHNTKVVMEKHPDSGYFQTGYINGKKQQSQRFDIVFGSIKGQTSAYWFTNMLFQLPISYIDGKWVNSPGFRPDEINFSRGIGVKCLDCHASYAKNDIAKLPGFYGNNEGFDKSAIIYSIDCERCHGPAAAHVKFHLDNPGEKQGKYIATFKSLTREQKINMCAVCHSGANSHMPGPTFGFKPGEDITKYMIPDPAIDFKHIDVHGNQKGLLESSKCFISSKMDCSTCHDTHINDRANAALYNTRCTTCHSEQNHNFCALEGKVSSGLLRNNCTSCHMPSMPSNVIVAGDYHAMVHTHHIAIYPDQTQKVLAYLKTDKK